jgi:transcriptional regulator with XRE-family HTH domain
MISYNFLDPVAIRNLFRYGCLVTRETAHGRFARLRRESGLTQVEVSTITGRTERAIRNWENGRNRIPRSVAPLVARALGITVAELDGADR